jgi:amino acid transporter
MSLIDHLLGKPLASHSEEEQKVGPLAGVPLLGLDGLASAAYGPEAAMTVLIPLGGLGLIYLGPIMGVLLLLLFVLYFSYRQTMAAYPSGGGSYTVSKENLGVGAGLLAAAALLLDYVLVVAVGISAGIGALISAFPALHDFRLLLCLITLILIGIINLRGIKESGLVFALPTYAFIATLGGTILVGLVKAIFSGGNPAPLDIPPPIEASNSSFVFTGATLWLLVRAFASGCTAMTGVEAVSNGMNAFRAPAVPNAQRTLTIIVTVLAALLAGIAYLVRIYHIGAVPPEGVGYESVISQLVGAVMGRGFFYYATIAIVLAVLALSANTGFADFPRLCRLIAEDDYLPHSFANRGRRLVYSMGIGILTTLSGLLLIAFGGITDRLIPLFAVGAFGAFTLSQAGMVRYWQRHLQLPRARLSQMINGIGAFITGLALLVVLAAKFAEGAWVTLLLIPLILILFFRVHRHYEQVRKEIGGAGEIELNNIHPPLIVVPIARWNTITEKALRFALSLSSDVRGLHIGTDTEDASALQQDWNQYVAKPAEEMGLNPPRLILVSSPYRRLFGPLLKYVGRLAGENPDRTIAVIIPELVEAHWYEYLLHNQRAASLKAALLLQGGSRVVVINVPWYLGKDTVCPPRTGKE